MPRTVSVVELTDLVTRVFRRHGVSAENADPVAETVVAAERDGAASHGLLRLPGYVSTLKSGWVDGRAVPVVTDAAPGLVATDAANGFAQPALRASAPLLREKARRLGIAAVAIRYSHHFAAVWPDVEPFAVEGFIVLAMVNGRQRMAVWGGERKLLGTSPMAFACPRPGRLPLVWDQASSVMAQGEILLAAQRGDMLPEGVGLDADGRPTTDPHAVLDGGSILAFGGHKGSSIAFMIDPCRRADRRTIRFRGSLARISRRPDPEGGANRDPDQSAACAGQPVFRADRGSVRGGRRERRRPPARRAPICAARAVVAQRHHGEQPRLGDPARVASLTY
jgi:delta1-piperideine-2-carboxylate reductase